MPKEIDLSTEALLAHRAIAEKATPGPWEVLAPDAIYISAPERNEILFENPQEIGTTLSPEEQRATAAHIAANSPNVVITHIDEILRLRGEVERLNKEADWLAQRLKEVCSIHDCIDCPFYDVEADYCRYEEKPWREAARKAVEKKI